MKSENIHPRTRSVSIRRPNIGQQRLQPPNLQSNSIVISRGRHRSYTLSGEGAFAVSWPHSR